MPKVLDKRVKALKEERGMPESRAYAIAVSTLQKEGKLQKGSLKSTRKGKGK